MFERNVSGQFLHFSLIGTASGLPVTGAAGAVSGRKVIDGGAMALTSGPVVEDGGGFYHLNVYDADINGKIVGFYFTSSGCVPVSYTVVTTANVSGFLYLASGSATALLSGQSTLPYSGSLSGQVVTAASGAFAVTSVTSGTVYLASGQNTVEIPKGVHTWNYSGAPNVSGQRCLLNAQRKLVNRWDLTSVSGFLAVYAEDDTTVALLQVVGATSGAAPVTSLDTN